MPETIGLIFEEDHWFDLYHNQLLRRGVAAEREKGLFPALRLPEGSQVICGTTSYGPGVAIDLELMAKHYGVSTVFRLGTCGGYADALDVGDVVVCTGAVRGEGTSHCYVPESNYPAVADFTLTRRVAEALEGAGQPYRTGVVWTTDGRIAGQYDPALIEKHRRHGVLGVEMESAAFFIVSQAKGMAAANLIVVVDVPLRDQEYKPFAQDQYYLTILPQLNRCAAILADASLRLLGLEVVRA